MSIYPRVRISEALVDSANRGISMVIAPAGFGKTEAVADAFGPAAHYVDAGDGEVVVEGLARAIVAAAAPDALRALGPLLARSADEENRAHLTSWVSAHLRSVEQPIIVEDAQHICADAASLAFLRDVIAATIPAVRWILVSRETPELPLGTWLARDYMTLPITADELAFDVEEAAGVAAAMGVTIDQRSLAELVADVSGWPLALRLSLGSWERTRSLPPLRIRTRAVLFEFLEAEVWSRLSEVEREFFDAAAHLAELRPRVLSAAGFPDSRLSLEALHRRMPLLSKLANGSFRLHELFRDFILERPGHDPAVRAALVKRLAHALERFGSLEESVAMSIRAEDWDGALALLSRRGVDRIESGHRAAITSALGQFPRSYRDHPVVTGLRGYALAIDGLYELAKKEIEIALGGELEASLRGPLMLQCAGLAFNTRDLETAQRINRQAMSDERFSTEVRLKAAASLAMTCAMAGDPVGSRDAIGFCTGALESGSVEVRALVRHRLAYAHLVLGNYALAELYATECAQLSHAAGFEAIAARAYSLLQAIASATYADVPAVRRYLELCLDSAEASGERSMHVFALEGLVLVACIQGDDDLFEARLGELRAMQGQRPLMHPVWMRFCQALRLAGLGQIDRAISEMSRFDRATLSKPAAAFTEAVLAVLYAGSDHERASAMLERPVLASAERDLESVRYLVYAQAFHALGHWLVGRGRAARRARFPDVNDLTPTDAATISVIGTICSASRQTITTRQLEQFTEPLVGFGLGGYARFLRRILAPAGVHELTRTELEILRELRSGGTTVEVAERLGKSSNTILSHIKSACSKIGCSGRSAAVLYAVNQGWID